MREIRFSGSLVGYRGNGSGVATQHAARVGGFGEGGRRRIREEEPVTEELPPAQEETLAAGKRRWWRNERDISVNF